LPKCRNIKNSATNLACAHTVIMLYHSLWKLTQNSWHLLSTCSCATQIWVVDSDWSRLNLINYSDCLDLNINDRLTLTFKIEIIFCKFYLWYPIEQIKCNQWVENYGNSLAWYDLFTLH
jgi:hypothetical protein